MFNLSSFLTKGINMFNIPATQFFLMALIGAFVVYAVINIGNFAIFRRYLLFAALAILIIYLKVSGIIVFSLIFAASYLVSKKLFRIVDNLLAFIVGIFTTIQLFIVISLLANPSVALFVSCLLSALIILLDYRQSWLHLKLAISGITKSVNQFNIFDWWLIITSAILGSLPQYHWDAAHANLYNAKWYVLHNSLAPLTESISSLFPQNAIAYYSMFYKIAQFQGFQLSFMLPLILIILIVKQLIQKTKLQKPLALALYASILTPIIIFQSSNGYYDLLIASLLLSAIYALVTVRQKNILQTYLISSFLIGFASGMKFFALALTPLPLGFIYYHRASIHKKLWPSLAVGLFLSVFSLGIWMVRTYNSTGSPVYPFFQDYFPTPQLWLGHDNLEQNFMIQTTMKTGDWLKGGFALYPISSYFHSAEFLEATKGYPGTIYVLAMLAELFLAFSLLSKYVKKQTISSNEIIFALAFTAYFVVGILTRYYRYLLPFQFILLFSAVVVISQNYRLSITSKTILNLIFSLTIALNFLNLVEYYRYYPIINQQVSHPDFYFNQRSVTGPISYINQISNTSQKILDGSQYLLPRLHLISETYQCNWYWINGSKLIDEETYDSLISQFSYLITSDPPENSTNYCQEFIAKAVVDINNKLVFSDHEYRIYQLGVQ